MSELWLSDHPSPSRCAGMLVEACSLEPATYYVPSEREPPGSAFSIADSEDEGSTKIEVDHFERVRRWKFY